MSYVYGDLILSQTHGCYVRFLRYDGSWLVVADRNTMKELPDQVHPAMAKKC